MPSEPDGTGAIEAPLTTAWPPASSMTTCAPASAIDLSATGDVGHVRDEVAHRAAGHEEGGCLAGQLGGALFESIDGGVVAEDVIAHFGGGHGTAHLGCRTRDGVAAKIDEIGHGRCEHTRGSTSDAAANSLLIFGAAGPVV